MGRNVFLVLGGILLSFTVHAVSLDCAKASAKVEKIICGDAELSKLDNELSVVYNASLQDAQHAKVVKESQRTWLRDVRTSCSDATCLKRAYKIQLSLLKDPIITTLGSMFTHDRSDYIVTLLANGKVLFMGGDDPSAEGKSGPLYSAELYDPITGRFTDTGNLAPNAGGVGSSATLLPTGKVLVSDGTQLYDPALSTFSAIDRFTSPHNVQTSTLLATGKVLITGTSQPTEFGVKTVLYDPLTGHFVASGSLATTRNGYTATPLPNGNVLFTGGTGKDYYDYLASAELYDPTTGTFSTAGNLAEARVDHTATLLRNGKVLVVGGIGANTLTLSSAEIYDPTTGHFVATGKLINARHHHIAILLRNGKVLIAGGKGADGNLDSMGIELFDPATGTFSHAGRLNYGGNSQTATLLQNGKVLFVGTSESEIYDPAAVELKR